MYAHGRRGFTLIEWSVVIFIIIIVAAILFPVFAKAREKVRWSSCLSNLKQLALANLQYAEDYNEILPSLKTQHGTKVPGDSVFEKLVPYIRNTVILCCASDTGTSRELLFQESGSPQSGIRPSYSQRYESSRLPVGCINDPKTYPLLIEGGPKEVWTPKVKLLNPEIWNISDVSGKAAGFTFLHNEGINIGWADGHCKWKKVDTLSTSSQPEGDMGSGQLEKPSKPKPTPVKGLVDDIVTMIELTSSLPPGTPYILVHDGVVVDRGKTK